MCPSALPRLHAFYKIANLRLLGVGKHRDKTFSCKTLISSKLCSNSFSHRSQMMTQIQKLRVSHETLTAAGFIGCICTVWILIANPQLGNAMFGSFTLEIVWRTAVFSLRGKHLLKFSFGQEQPFYSKSS